MDPTEGAIKFYKKHSGAYELVFENFSGTMTITETNGKISRESGKKQATAATSAQKAKTKRPSSSKESGEKKTAPPPEKKQGSRSSKPNKYDSLSSDDWSSSEDLSDEPILKRDSTIKTKGSKYQTPRDVRPQHAIGRSAIDSDSDSESEEEMPGFSQAMDHYKN